MPIYQGKSKRAKFPNYAEKSYTLCGNGSHHLSFFAKFRPEVKQKFPVADYCLLSGGCTQYARFMTKEYSAYSDAELYMLLLGERQERDIAFREIYNRHSSRVFLYCRRILGDVNAADDAFQETFSLFLRSISPEREMTNLPAFLLRIARNACLRMKQRLNDHPTSSFDEGMYMLSPEEQPVEHEELARLIAMALDLLPDDQREALVLQAYEGMSYQEIGEMMNVPITTVRNWIVRAKRKVRETLTPYWADYRK